MPVHSWHSRRMELQGRTRYGVHLGLNTQALNSNKTLTFNVVLARQMETASSTYAEKRG